MASSSRMDRLVNMLGGQQNLPPKAPQTTSASDIAKAVAQEGGTADKSDSEPAKEEEQVSQDWWDLTPQLPQQPHSSNGTIGMSATSDPSPQNPQYPFDPRKGEPAPLGISFSPFAAVTKFCYKFVRRDLVQPLATAFFDNNKIWGREWDVYYIWSDHFPTAKPILFVTEYQLIALINEINQQFPEAKIKISDDLREDGLIINFDEIDTPDLRPRFLGHSTSRDQIDHWTNCLPLPERVMGHSTDPRHEAFREKMERTNEVSKNKSKAAKQKRQAEHVIKRQDMVRMMTRAERYLGMVPALSTEVPASSLESAFSSLSLSPIETTNIMPFPFDSDVIFIAVDLEANERPPHQITEVGFATLDTRDLKLMAPGPNGTEWHKAIRGRHIRVAEYLNIVNKDFVAGCPDKFEFGKSEIVGNDKLTSTIASYFKPPYSGPPAPIDEDEEKRNVVLVGHDISADINYLRKLGYNVANCSNIVDTMDTAQMFRAYTKDPNPRSLGNVLLEFDLTGWWLHNAGNDAVYTLRVMLAMCVRDASERGSAEAAKEKEEKLLKRAKEAEEQARQRIQDDLEGWEHRGDDGGIAIPPALPAPKPTFGPKRKEERQYFTKGGAILDV